MVESTFLCEFFFSLSCPPSGLRTNSIWMLQLQLSEKSSRRSGPGPLGVPLGGRGKAIWTLILTRELIQSVVGTFVCFKLALDRGWPLGHSTHNTYFFHSSLFHFFHIPEAVYASFLFFPLLLRRILSTYLVALRGKSVGLDSTFPTLHDTQSVSKTYILKSKAYTRKLQAGFTNSVY